ncbi:hypothetical protein [Promicromonospora sp. NPDC023805]|uniref:hypothetical protein n=1 Tax=Promicromonospora sp. NPDC023805 TaxID=3154696 RepID=UPI0033ED1505
MTSCFECRELGCGGELTCDCGCHEQYDDLVDGDAFTLGCGVDHNRVTECDECDQCIACHECRCYDSNWWERVDGAPTAVAAWELAA